MRHHSGSGSVWSSASVLSFKQARKQVKLTFHPRVCLSASQLVGATVKLPLCLQLVFFQLKHWGNCLFCSFIYVLEWQYCTFTIKEGLLPHKSHTRHSINKCIGHFHPYIHTYTASLSCRELEEKPDASFISVPYIWSYLSSWLA